LLSSKTALGRAASPAQARQKGSATSLPRLASRRRVHRAEARRRRVSAAVLPCRSTRPRVVHQRRIPTTSSVSLCLGGKSGILIHAFADRDAARQRESDLRLIPSLNLCLPGSRNHSPNHRLSSQKTSLYKFQQVWHKAGTSLAQGQNKPKQIKTSLNKRF